MLSVEAFITSAQIRWTGHVIDMPEHRLPKISFYVERKGGNREPGGQKLCYKDSHFVYHEGTDDFAVFPLRLFYFQLKSSESLFCKPGPPFNVLFHFLMTDGCSRAKSRVLRTYLYAFAL